MARVFVANWNNGFQSAGSTYYFNRSPDPTPEDDPPGGVIANKLSHNMAPFLRPNRPDTLYSYSMYHLMECLQDWKPANANNWGGHRGKGSNVLFADGSVIYVRFPWKEQQALMGYGLPDPNASWHKILRAREGR